MDTVKADIRWALNCVAWNISNSFCMDVDKLFQTMFSDSKMVKQ